MIVFGIMLLFVSIQSFTTIWTSRSDLIAVTGTLQYINWVKEISRDFKGRERESDILEFWLYQHPYRFRPILAIDDDNRYAPYNELQRHLNHVDSITVYILKSEKKKSEPEVFEIVGDDRVLLEFDAHRTKDRFLAAFTLILGIASLAYGVASCIPKYRYKIDDFFK